MTLIKNQRMNAWKIRNKDKITLGRTTLHKQEKQIKESLGTVRLSRIRSF